MTKDERKLIAADLLGLIFKLRPVDTDSTHLQPGEEDDETYHAFNGNAWVMEILEQGISRAIAASIGPDADPDDMLEAHRLAVREAIMKAQAEFRRARFVAGGRQQPQFPGQQRGPF
jgi:hypothetical protein